MRRTILLVIIGVATLFVAGCYMPETPSKTDYAYDAFGLDFQRGKTIYLEYNLWYTDPMDISGINYHTGKIIPFGTPIEFVDAQKDKLTFKTPYSAQLYRVINDQPKTLLKDDELFHMIFTQDEDPMSKFKTINPEILKDMKNGIITLGMTRDEVLAAYGPGPRYLNQLSDVTWTYLINTQLKTTHIVFKDDLVNYIFDN